MATKDKAAAPAEEAPAEEAREPVLQPGGVPRPLDEPPADKPKMVRCWACGALKPEPRFPGRERLETHPDLPAPVDEFCPNCGRGELPLGSPNRPLIVPA